jgi:hypothetical protein
MRFAQAYTLG